MNFSEKYQVPRYAETLFSEGRAVRIPASKSHAQRAVLIAALIAGESYLRGLTLSDDLLAAVNAAKQWGATCTFSADMIRILGVDFRSSIAPASVSCGESGLLSRMLLGISAGHPTEQPFEINGTGSLLRRSFEADAQLLESLGIRVKLSGFGVPVRIEGRLSDKKYTVDGSHSSQLISGLLCGAALGQHDTTFEVTQAVSRSYLTMTTQTLTDFGARIQQHDDCFHVEKSTLHPSDITLEGDWSSAAYFAVAGAVASSRGLCESLIISNIQSNSVQADRAVCDVLRRAGALIDTVDEGIRIRAHTLKAFEFDATHAPDLFPALVALAIFCRGTSRIDGVHRLYNKESNRAQSLVAEFSKFGAAIRCEHDTMYITASDHVAPIIDIDTHADHRIAMSTVIAGLFTDAQITVSGIACIAKSYPGFLDELKLLSYE